MVECDHRFDAALTKPGQHLPVASDGCAIKDPFFWLDTAPFYRQAMGIVAHLSHEIKVALGIAPPVACQPAAMLMPDRPWLLFKGPPVVVGVASLNLVGRTGRAPEESRWKAQELIVHELVPWPKSMCLPGFFQSWGMIMPFRRGVNFSVTRTKADPFLRGARQPGQRASWRSLV